MLQVVGGFARETTIKVSPYGVSLYVVQCFQAKLLSVLQVGGRRRKLHGVFLWNVVVVLYEVCRPSSTESSIGRTVVVQMSN